MIGSHSSSKTIPPKEIYIQYGKHSFSLLVDWSVGIGGDYWPAADQFCHLISNRNDELSLFFTNLFNNKTCLELGSGNGLVSILINRQYNPSKIITTDLISHVSLIQLNIDKNNGSIDVKNDHEQIPLNRIVAVDYDWLEGSSVLQSTYDIIIALECVYRDELYEPLVKSILVNSHSDTITFVGLTKSFAKPSFFRILKDFGLLYRKIPFKFFKTLADYGVENNLNNKIFADENIGLFIVYKAR
eukprot:gene10670-14329_t